MTSPEDNIEKVPLIDEKIDKIKDLVDILNKHWHSVGILINHLSHPIVVDDRGLHQTLCHLRETLNNVIEAVKVLDISQSMSEIKYIGKRLLQIESDISEIKKEGITKKVHLDFTVDGYEMVKKGKRSSKETSLEVQEKDPDQDLKELLSTLFEREQLALCHRFGLLGHTSKTYVKMATCLKVSAERCSMIVKKALRKLRHPSRRNLAEKITHKNLRKELFDE